MRAVYNKKVISGWRRSRELPEFLTEEEMDRLIDGVEDLRDKTILETMYATGCRPKELRMMRISNINFEAGNIRLMRKNGQGAYVKERIVLITEKAIKLIIKYLERRGLPGEDVLFLGEDQRPLSSEELNRIVSYYVKTVLGKDIRRGNPAYVIRHSFATMMYNNGVNLVAISELLGHDNVSSVQVYTHTGINRLMEVHKNFHPRG